MIYNTGKQEWEHGRAVAWDSWDRSPSRRLLGPCPQCGAMTSNYGFTYSCHSPYCQNSANIFVCGPEPTPDWWNTGINVFIDGDAWCAVGVGFIDIQESPCGFGKTPREAVVSFREKLGGKGE